MKDFFIYFYYRTYQLYKGPARSNGPISFLIGFNLLFIFNILFRLLDLIRLVPDAFQPVTVTLIWVDGIILILISIITVPLLIYRNKKLIFKKMGEFKKETAPERKRNGRSIFLYIILSVILLALSFVKS